MSTFPGALIELGRSGRDCRVAEGLHVAIIMDGNGRWARRRHLPRTSGHARGAEAVRHVVKGAVEIGVTHLTLFGFSSENWRRPQAEVQHLMGLLRRYLQRNLTELDEGGIRLSVIGVREELPPDIVALIADAERRTQHNNRLYLTIALNYGGRADILSAARSLAEQVRRADVSPQEIDEARFAASLSTAPLPDPDLLIRTSGEQRLSNFLLWQLAYAEMVFVDKCWPDFTGEDLAAAVLEFRRRDRRFGAILPDALAGAAILP